MASSSYKPPVQNSVSKLRSSRFGSTSSSSSSGSGGGTQHGDKNNNNNAAASGAGGGSTRRRAAAASLLGGSPPLASAAATPSFEDRMRGLLGRQEMDGLSSNASSSSPQNRNVPSNMHVVDNLRDYRAVVVGEDTDGPAQQRLVCVGFFAPWCKSCKAALPLFYRMAMKFPSVTFVHVPVTAHNANLHQGLGVRRLPSGHIYHPSAGLVEDDLRLTKGTMATFGSVLQSYVRGSCDLVAVTGAAAGGVPLEEDDDDEPRGGTASSSNADQEVVRLP